MAAAILVLSCRLRNAPPRPAPVIDRGSEVAKKPPRKPTVADARPEFHTVKKGDTLHSIALEQGIDYRDLAAWNGITDANRIALGQQLRLRPPGVSAGGTVTSAPTEGGEPAVAAPLAVAPASEGKPLDPDSAARTPGPAVPRVVEATPSTVLVKSPKAQRLPYSEDALAQLRGQSIAICFAGGDRRCGRIDVKIGEAGHAETGTNPDRPPKTELAKVDPKPEPPPMAPPEAQAGDEDDRVNWSWPASGKVVAPFSEGSNLKGIGIGGKAGQPVLASAGGKVVYAGSGYGYGKLVIIKHNKTYLVSTRTTARSWSRKVRPSPKGRRSPRSATPTPIRRSCTSRSGVSASRSIR